MLSVSTNRTNQGSTSNYRSQVTSITEKLSLLVLPNGPLGHILSFLTTVQDYTALMFTSKKFVHDQDDLWSDITFFDAKFYANSFFLSSISKKLKNLKVLNLEDCQHISEVAFHHLHMLSLKCLNLIGCRNITSKSLSFLPTSLSYLNLGSLKKKMCPINNADLASLKHLTQLKGLDLLFCNITNIGLFHLRILPLESLNLYACRNISNICFLNLDYIQTLNLSCCNIDDISLSYLKSPHLKNLNLAHCYKITDSGLVYLRNFSLANLNLQDCSITDDGLINLVNVPLTHLNLANCDVSDKGLVHLPRTVIELNLSNCKKLTDKGVHNLQYLPLVSLNLSHCKISDNSLTNFPISLRFLWIRFCINITDAALVKLRLNNQLLVRKI